MNPEQETLPIENVIAVHNASRNGRDVDPLVFTVHYAQRAEGRNWKYCRITFRHTDSTHVSSWVKTLQSDLQSKFDPISSIMWFECWIRYCLYVGVLFFCSFVRQKVFSVLKLNHFMLCCFLSNSVIKYHNIYF